MADKVVLSGEKVVIDIGKSYSGMTAAEQWECQDPIRTLGVEVPRWIDQDISPSTIQAILQGGCASGAYMQAMWYEEAIKTMGQYGDEVVAFLDEHVRMVSGPHGVELGDGWPAFGSWGEIACYYLSSAVEVWCRGAASDLEQD